MSNTEQDAVVEPRGQRPRGVRQNVAAVEVMAQLVLWLVPVLTLLILTTTAAHAKRVALVIGNAQYQNEKPLKNPVNDAHALARTLKEDLQFDDVIERSNVTRRELGRLIDQLGQRAQGADAVVVYYSGHGMQGAGGNYLIPVDAQITSTEDVKLEGVPANDVVDVLNQSGARVALLILDACRDNPFRTRTKGGSKGLARMNVSGGNLLVAYATQEGDTADDGTGSNSPYAQALIQNLKRKDLRVLEVFDEVAQQVKASTAQKQRPTRYGDLPVNVFLTTPPTQLASLQPLPVRPAPNGPMGGAANFGDREVVQAQALGGDTLSVKAREDSWVDVRDAKGRMLISRLVRAGENVSLSGVAPLQIKIGNAQGTDLYFRDRPVDLSPAVRDNVARLELK